MALQFKLSKTLMGAALAACLSTTTVSAAELRGWNIHVEDYPVSIAMESFMAEVTEKTGGEITGKTFHNGVLGSQPDAIEQVRLGGLAVGNFNLGPIGPIAPEANVVSLPFIFKDVPHMFRVLEGEGGQMISDGMAAKGLIPLAWYDAGARSFYNGTKAINAPDDVIGLCLLYTSPSPRDS